VKTKANDNFDQSFYEDGIRALTEETAQIETRFAALGKEAPVRPAAASGKDLIQAYNALAIHVANLRTEIGALPSAVRAVVASGIAMDKPGVQVETLGSAATGKKLTLTEQIMAARKVSTIDALPVRNGALD